MAFENPSDDCIRRILGSPRTIAVVGCSPDPTRDSHRVARLLLARGHRVLPVNPTVSEVLGRRSVPSLADLSEPVDMVDVFRRPEEVAGVVDQVLAIDAPVLWLQIGVIDEPAALRAVAAGRTVVMDRCPAIEYARLFTPTPPHSGGQPCDPSTR